MTFSSGVRILALALASGLVVVGVLMMTGTLNRQGIGVELRVGLGAIVMLYGLYKFTVMWFRRTGKDDR
jgi:hypothetical protein